MPRISQKPMLDFGEKRQGRLPSSEEKARHFDDLERKRIEEAAVVKAATAAPVRPPVPSPAERHKTVDECLGFKASAVDPVDVILFGERNPHA